MGIEITTDRNMFGKRTGYVTAKIGEFSTQGRNLTEARNGLYAQIEAYKPKCYVIGAVSAVFVVRQSINGGTEYSICGAGRTYASGCLMSETDFAAAIDRARKHASESFGGIVWEHPA